MSDEKSTGDRLRGWGGKAAEAARKAKGAYDEHQAGRAEQAAAATADPTRPLFTPASAAGLLVFFALCTQCASTLAVIRRETGSWKWMAVTFLYMITLAYLASLLTYQIATRLGAG